jgi:hypothetical protein
VLGIYERFYLPLQESLRPATKAFILALLPGLEEETGEFFEKVRLRTPSGSMPEVDKRKRQVSALLDRVSGTVSPSFFFQNVWLVLMTAPNSRIPAINYLAKRLPKMENDDSAPHFSQYSKRTKLTRIRKGLSHIVGKDVGLMVRGFAAALEDPQLLVQRGILDLLTTTLKIDGSGFKGCASPVSPLVQRD